MRDIFVGGRTRNREETPVKGMKRGEWLGK